MATIGSRKKRTLYTSMGLDEERWQFCAEHSFGWVRGEGSAPGGACCSKAKNVSEGCKPSNNGVKQAVREVSPALGSGKGRGARERDSRPFVGALHDVLLMPISCGRTGNGTATPMRSPAVAAVFSGGGASPGSAPLLGRESKVSDPSECGSTTGATGESESHRKWREMKQNGFLSSTHGTAVAPKPRGRPPKRKRDDELKRNTSTQNEQIKFTKVAAPSGLLSGLNPGIINHVRNSKQVYSIIKAMVRSEELENTNQPGLAGQTGERGKEVIDRIQDQKYGDSLMKCHLMMEGNNAMFHHGLPTASKFLAEDGDNLKLQLSSTVTMASDRTCSTLDHESQHDYMTVLSVKAASVASQWLELLQQDIRGRLAALKRSRKRVRNALQTELPHLISTEFSSSQENEPSIAHSSEAGPTGKTVSEEHVARWRSLFLQMERTLQEEGRHLEIRLKEVQGMLQNCDKGLKQVTCEAPLLGPMAELWKLKNPEISESEWAVQAAAASIYSTCNLVMKTENVSCF